MTCNVRWTLLARAGHSHGLGDAVLGACGLLSKVAVSVHSTYTHQFIYRWYKLLY